MRSKKVCEVVGKLRNNCLPYKPDGVLTILAFRSILALEKNRCVDYRLVDQSQRLEIILQRMPYKNILWAEYAQQPALDLFNAR